MWLLLGDTLGLSLFILGGLQTHESTSPLTRFAVNAGPLILTWAFVAWRLGALRLEPPLEYRAVLGRTLTAWLVAAPLALILRAILLHAATIALIFMLITLGLGGVILLLWRGALVWFLRRRG